MTRLKAMGGRRAQEGRLTPEQVQRDFYASTAADYDSEMVRPGDEHFVALDYISALVDGFGYRSVLDVGSGTGRAVKHFLDGHDQLEVRGVEPVPAMIEQAMRKGVPEGRIVRASGDSLPFDDEAFDAVCEFGVLHHVANPNAIV